MKNLKRSFLLKPFLLHLWVYHNLPKRPKRRKASKRVNSPALNIKDIVFFPELFDYAVVTLTFQSRKTCEGKHWILVFVKIFGTAM